MNVNAAAGRANAPSRPARAVIAAEDTTADTSADMSADSAGAQAFSKGLLQGQGAKKGILKRMSVEEITSVQALLSAKASSAATEILASRETEATEGIDADDDTADVGDVTPDGAGATSTPLSLGVADGAFAGATLSVGDA